jgi:hypothetical protein
MDMEEKNDLDSPLVSDGRRTVWAFGGLYEEVEGVGHGESKKSPQIPISTPLDPIRSSSALLAR